MQVLRLRLCSCEPNSAQDDILKVPDVVHDFGAGEILGTDEFAADDAVGVDDVGFGGTGGIEGVVGLLG